jgi:hypothetical protein
MLVVLVLAVGFGLVACGGDDEKSDEDQIRDVIALGNNQDPKVCDKVTDKWLRDVTGGDKADCEKQVKEDPENDIEIDKISVQGDRATVNVSLGRDTGKIFFVKEDDEWKLDDIQQG